MGARTAIGAAILIALILIIVFFANKPVAPPECTGSGACPDLWVDPSDKPIATKQVCSGDGKIVNPVGPGKCTNPCPDGQVACWSAGENLGHCVVGTSCPPCFTDIDCGGASQGSCQVASGAFGGVCVCKPPYFGPKCSADCKSGDVCGKNGTCSADGKSCVCKPGWADSPSGPCTVCANDYANNNAWGPPGVCNYRKYATAKGKDGVWGAALPLTTNGDNCDLRDPGSIDDACVAEFGNGAFFPPDWDEDSKAPDPQDQYECDNPNACLNYGSSQSICWVPNGYYGLPGNDPDPSKYSPCDIGADGKTAKPPGYIRPVGS